MQELNVGSRPGRAILRYRVIGTDTCVPKQGHRCLSLNKMPDILMKPLHTHYMQEALKEARKAFERNEVPVGAVIVYKDRIIARAHNQIVTLKDPTAHAEMIAITQAADYLKNERLINCSLYVTIEPCAMCTGASVLARMKRIIYGACDPKSGACGSVLNVSNNKKLNHKIEVFSGVLQKDCSLLLKEFFKKRRLAKQLVVTAE